MSMSKEDKEKIKEIRMKHAGCNVCGRLPPSFNFDSVNALSISEQWKDGLCDEHREANKKIESNDKSQG